LQNCLQLIELNEMYLGISITKILKKIVYSIHVSQRGQPRSQGFSLEGGKGGKRPWHRLVSVHRTP